MGDVPDVPDVDAATGSGFDRVPNFVLVFKLSPRTSPGTGVCCCRDLTSSVPEPYVGMTAVKPD
jgi:hypothetical protein